MDTIPQAALEEIVRRPKNGPMYRHEWIQMANELLDLRARFNKREDEQTMNPWKDNPWLMPGSSPPPDMPNQLHQLTWGLHIGGSVVIGDQVHLLRYRITKENW